MYKLLSLNKIYILKVSWLQIWVWGYVTLENKFCFCFYRGLEPVDFFQANMVWWNKTHKKSPRTLKILHSQNSRKQLGENNAQIPKIIIIFPSIYCEYVLLPLVYKEVTWAYVREEYRQAGRDIERINRVKEAQCSCWRRHMPATY